MGDLPGSPKLQEVPISRRRRPRPPERPDLGPLTLLLGLAALALALSLALAHA
jgi:hypothetical protein